ncbi:UPF0496 protein family [Cocos nucifera]|uniref:UPF0496 protein family n=1 Tax=Cocos nucifera TaxID=13894 RepID=A0A8K0I7V4_COCNU|nr:UPF0496 protein family [Cocos nucifera]
MGGQLSTGTSPVLNVDGGGTTSASAGDGHSGMEYLAELSSYEMACRLDPKLRSFDTTLQRRTNRVISTLAHGVEVRSLSFDSLRAVIGCLLEMNEEVVKAVKGQKEILSSMQKEILSSMQVGTYIVIKNLDGIRVLVDRLEAQINVLLDVADFALRDEEAVKFGIQEIKEKLKVFMKSIEDLRQQADRCSRDIGKARTVVLQKIIRSPN